MKRRILILTTLIALTFTFSTFSFAQFGDLINKAKEAAKKKDKKTETKPAENKRTDSSPGESKQTEAEQPAAQNQLGTIYFSNQPFPADGSVTGAKTSFNSGEFIYGRLVLKSGTVRSVLKPYLPADKSNNNLVRYGIYYWHTPPGGSPSSSHWKELSYDARLLISPSDLEKNYLDFDVFPSPDKAMSMLWWDINIDNYEHRRSVDSIYNFLTQDTTNEGEYKMGVDFVTNRTDFRGNRLPDSEQQEVEGTFSFTFRGSDYATIKTNKERLTNDFLKRSANAAYESQEAPPEWKEASAAILSITSAPQLKSLYLGIFKASDRPSLRILKLHATQGSSAGWIIEKDNIGIPRYRYSGQYYTVFVKNIATNDCFFDEFGLRQDYAGGGRYSGTRIDRREKSQKFLKCDKLGLK